MVTISARCRIALAQSRGQRKDQPGSSLGLATLVAISAVGAHQLAGVPLLAHRVTVALGSAAAMLALALLLVLSCRRRG